MLCSALSLVVFLLGFDSFCGLIAQLQIPDPKMMFCPLRHGVPVEIESTEVVYPPSNSSVVYKKVSSTVWVDEGEGDWLHGHKYEAWYKWRGLSWEGPLAALDEPVYESDGSHVRTPTFGGEVEDPDLMDTDESDSPVRMEFDGDDDFFVGQIDEKAEDYDPVEIPFDVDE